MALASEESSAFEDDSGGYNGCWNCKREDTRLQSTARAWMAMLGDSANPALDAVLGRVGSLMKADAECAPLYDRVKLADGEWHTLRVWGLPPLRPEERRGRRVRAAMQKIRMDKATSLASRAPVRFLVERDEEDVALAVGGRLEQFRRGGDEYARTGSHWVGHWGRELAKASRAKHEVEVAKREKDEVAEARARSVKANEYNRKAARKRSARR
ncbi:hypothetical protein LTR36_004553 [Oleoguttula mirabilis]|uniref:Uncharacterized protein n=1 Tax=Oleoguttula mirabilis TaxID=1507867 RepID=A0AAV9JFP4_9PEZI|nr:hypothetical protein LTR36_004553 [Oleoguttula mirabilis]